MPTMTLTPDGLAASPGWAANTGTVNDALLTNDGDTTYAEAGTDTETCTLTFAAPSVAEGDIASIDSVRFISSGRSTDRGGADARMSVTWMTPSGNSNTTCAFDQHVSAYETINGSDLSYSDGSGGTGWTYANLEDASIKLTKVLTVQLRLSFFALEVTYTAVAVTDNAVFFGTNF